MQKFYDSDLQSDIPFNFESDNEPPKDIIRELKQVYKKDLFRVQKEILQIGNGIDKPAKYDEIIYKFYQLKEDSQENVQNTQFLLENVKNHEEIHKTNLGLNDQTEWFHTTLEDIKRNEICILTLEYLKLDENELKILDRYEYILIHLQDFTTVIDLFADLKYLKRVIQKGEGSERADACDELIFNYRIKYNGELLQEQKFEEIYIAQKDILDKENMLSKNLWRILKTMKKGEVCACEVDVEEFKQNEKKMLVDKNLEKLKTLEIVKESWEELKDKEHKFVVEIELIDLIKIDDIFSDQSCLKKMIRGGFANEKPEKTSKILFHLQIHQENGNLIYQSAEDIKPLKRKDLQFEQEEYADCQKGAWHLHIDEYKLSKFLKNVLLRMKIGEHSKAFSNVSSEMVTYGRDHEEVMKKLGSIPDKLVYTIHVYFFTIGKNTFNMTIDEKIQQAIRKKEIGVKLIKNKHYKKALKSFQTINAYFDLGTFYGEDKIKIQEYKRSSLLNTSLCQMKMSLWEQLILTCTKILQDESDNCKAAYRKVTGMIETMEYDAALLIIENFEKKIESDFEKYGQYRADFEKIKARCLKLNQNYQKKSKQAFSKLFQ